VAAFWDRDRELVLLTPNEFDSLPDGTELTCIDGEVAVKGRDYIDDDLRFGHMAYGVTGDHPIRLKHLSTIKKTDND
jgi:hypothetical protein